MDEHTADDALPPPSDLQVVLPFEDFEEDLDLRLGRANGNIYHRRPGVEGSHDGQVMVRLKKKRFIVIDYSILPCDEDLQTAAMSPHISCPPGAGKTKCVTPECTKVGVPVLLYDSDPTEPASLYLRSGLCFICQRNLNEKRRTQRKRGSDAGGTSLIYAVGPGQKKFKLNGGVIELNSDAIILNAPADGSGAKSHADGFGFHEIGMELQSTIQAAVHDADRLVHAVSGNTTTTSTTGGADDNVVDIAATAAAAAVAAVGDGDQDHDLSIMTDEATNAAVDATNGLLNSVGVGDHHTTHTHTSEDISALYDAAFSSLSNSIYSLSQWKQSWDAAIAAAVVQETVGDPSLADAVASAAAVVAAAAEGNSTNMVSLLMAADQHKEDGKPQDDVQAFEV